MSRTIDSEASPPGDATRTADRLPTPAVGLAVDALDRLFAGPPGPMSLRQLARDLDAPRSTLNRVMKTLEHKGMVTRIKEGYLIGPHATQWVAHAASCQLTPEVFVALSELSDCPGTSALATVSADSALLVSVSTGTDGTPPIVPTGTRFALHASALGKAYLAVLPDGARQDLVSSLPLMPATDATLRDRRQLTDDLENARRQGYAQDNGEAIDDVICIAAAIRGISGTVIATVGQLITADSVTQQELNVICERVTAAAAMVSSNELETIPATPA